MVMHLHNIIHSKTLVWFQKQLYILNNNLIEYVYINFLNINSHHFVHYCITLLLFINKYKNNIIPLYRLLELAKSCFAYQLVIN